MRVLALVLASAKYRDRLDAVLHTWGARPPEFADLRFCADTALSAELGERFWPCVQSGSRLDTYQAIPIKLLEGLRRARELPWDFLVKTDDDCYLAWDRLQAHLSTLDPAAPLYLGNGYRSVLAEADRDQWTVLAGGDFTYHFGAALVLTRPALEQIWAPLQLALAREGTDDAILGAVAHRFGLQTVAEPHLYFGASPERLTHGCAVIAELDSPARAAEVHAALQALPEGAPLVVSASTAWGEVGANGWLGYEEDGGSEVRVGGVPRPRALSAHAPSRLLVKLPPGAALRLTGAINDSATTEAAHATFRATSSSGALLADLGEARLGQPTSAHDLRVPSDGLVTLSAETAQYWHSHAVWLY